jgi:hypothetical protein
MTAAPGLGLTNRVVNPVLMPLLRTRAGRSLGSRLAVLRYTGVRTGRLRELVVGYARSGPTVWIVVGQPRTKRWWRALATPAEVTLWLAGERVHGRGVAVDGASQPAEARRGLAAYLDRMPAAARAFGITDRHDPGRLAAAAARVLLVRVDLHPEPDAAA